VRVIVELMPEELPVPPGPKEGPGLFTGNNRPAWESGVCQTMALEIRKRLQLRSNDMVEVRLLPSGSYGKCTYHHNVGSDLVLIELTSDGGKTWQQRGLVCSECREGLQGHFRYVTWSEPSNRSGR